MEYLSTMPLAERMWADMPEMLVPWYADISNAVGKAADTACGLKYLQEEGPKYGYHSEPAKCIYVCKAEDKALRRIGVLCSRGF